jgi:hypothetical protein
VHVEITPEPTPEEREAMLRALALLDGKADAPGTWWQAGVREATEDEQDEG